ncbi:hypothetical protein HHK36_011330 [Tetracentron sinense]|uniref:Myb-like domain-containing protein n=1 Tax=Tetracentron sinense TaxID=13715 RepID=A0A834Z913_TETSI|nr:hypothetical protein HHK36_011330 [Tetracentron sinense]
MEMGGDQYGLPDLRQLMDGRTHFPAIPQATEPFSLHRNLTTGHDYGMIMVGRQVGDVLPRGVIEFRSDHSTTTTPTTTTTTTTSAAAAAAFCGLEMESGCIGGDGGNGRWPRQETLTLLEIRSRLDPKFKEANQKGPLWDEVSRIMAEEHGYQRSGKKCREKFENLYKYYKKTKEGKAGRQDGKHYRFFRQLEALYGETSNPASVLETHHLGNNLPFHTTNSITTHTNQESFQAQKLCESLSFSNSSEFDTSSSEDNGNDLTAIAFMENDSSEKKKMKDNQSVKRGRKSWKGKMREFVDSQMRKLIETQESWLEKMLNTLQHKEQERMSREEEWRKQETARFDREFKFWANERAWVEARDAALMEALQKITGKELKNSSPEGLMATELQNHSKTQNENGCETLHETVYSNRWPEPEISSLIQLRTSMESRVQQGGCSQGAMWEEIASKMACLGYDRSAMRCKEKWENINNYFSKTKDCNKKRKENSRTCPYYQRIDSAYCGHNIEEEGSETVGLESNNEDPSPSNSNAGTAMPDSCFRFLMAEGDNLWENYGVKLNKGDNQ